MKQYLTLLTGTLLLVMTGCSKETGPSGTGESPISFDMASTGVETRALNEISTDADLRNESIGVFASYTGKFTYENTTVSPDFMYNQEVKYTANNVWEYDPVKYWPNNEEDHVSFFAYAPYEASPREGSSTGIIDMSRKVDYGDPWINFRLPEDVTRQVDLLFGQRYIPASGATPARFESWLDQQKYNWGDNALKFTFKHALACIGETITIRMSDALYAQMHNSVDITFNSVTIVFRNLTTKARLVLRSSGDPNWKEIISGELTCSRTYDSGTLSGKSFSKDAASNPDPLTLDSGHGVFYIPLQVSGTQSPSMDISIHYTVDNGIAPFTDTAVAQVVFTPQEAGTKQGIVLTLTSGFNLDADIITASNGIGMPGTITPEPGF